MQDATNKRRFWSDGHGIYHLATFGERLSAGIAEWAVVFVIGLVLSVIVSTVYGYIVAGDPYAYYVYGEGENDKILLFIPLTIVFGTIAHLVSTLLVARFGVSFGYRVMALAVKRENAGRLGWWRCVVRKFVGSPLLSVPYLTLLLWVLSGDAFVEYWSGATVGLVIVIAALVFLNHAWIRFNAQWRCLSDVLTGTVVVQDRILSTNRAAFPSVGREPV